MQTNRKDAAEKIFGSIVLVFGFVTFGYYSFFVVDSLSDFKFLIIGIMVALLIISGTVLCSNAR